MTDVRTFSPTPMDLALVSRLASDQLLMDTTTALTKGVNPLEAALLTVVPLADLGFPTLVLRDQDHGYIGQIRHRSGDTHAHLALLAPAPTNDVHADPWVRLVEGLLKMAAQRGALTVVAEVPEHEAAAFSILRQTGFVVYARQTIYRHVDQPNDDIIIPSRVKVRFITAPDIPNLQQLYAKLVPSLIQQSCPLAKPELRPHDHSLVVESVEDGRLLGHLALWEGRTGLLLKPLLHPDLYDEVAGILKQAFTFWPKIERLPLHACIRSYQEWLHTPLEDIGMYPQGRQVLFVKHMAVRVKTDLERLANAIPEKSFGKLVGNWDINLQQD